jgi:beta-phosphoglucomutase-like phosphatase (HAD superfamily)
MRPIRAYCCPSTSMCSVSTSSVDRTSVVCSSLHIHPLFDRVIAARKSRAPWGAPKLVIPASKTFLACCPESGDARLRGITYLAR